MLKFRRVILLIFLFIAYFFTASFFELYFSLTNKAESFRQKRRAKHSTFYAKGIVKIIGFKVNIVGGEHLNKKGALFVSNHLSFWDIAILSSFNELSYITSVEVEKTLFLGWIAKLSGCQFIERRKKDFLNQEILSLADALTQNQNVVLFPEGTTGNGSTLLPFKRSFFKAAVYAQKPIVSLCINYLKLDNVPVNSQNRDLLFYYGDHRFFNQLIAVLSIKITNVEVVVFPPISSKQKEENMHKHLCEESFRLIHNRFVPIEV